MAYTSMYEMWRTQVEDKPFDLLLDLGHGEDYPLKTHPWFFGVRIPMTNNNEAGMCSPGESSRLDAVENRIRELIKAREGIYVGRMTGGGNRDLLSYFPERPRGIEDRVRASIGMEILFISREDRKWSGYQQLLPNEKDWRRIEDQKLIDHVMDLGTDPSKAHILIHMVETTSQKGAEAIAKLMEKLELTNISIEGARPDLTVAGTQITPLDHETILRVSWILESKSPKARGKYLSWSADTIDDDNFDDLDIGGFGDAGGDSLIAAVLAKLAK